MKKALFGNGGHADEVEFQIGLFEKLTRFVDDEYYKNISSNEIQPLSKFDPKEYELMICVGESQLRKKIVEKLPKETNFFSFIHPTALIMNNNLVLGKGCFIGAYSIITTNIVLGNHCILNRGNHIGHNCKIGNYFSMMPGSIVSGDCQIDENVYMGTNSSIKEKVNVCKDVVIGMNAAVIKNINKPGTYLGVPAKLYEKIK